MINPEPESSKVAKISAVQDVEKNDSIEYLPVRDVCRRPMYWRLLTITITVELVIIVKVASVVTIFLVIPLR